MSLPTIWSAPSTASSTCWRAASLGGLVGGDASLIKADANREDGIEPERWSPEEHASRATAEYLETLDDAATWLVRVRRNAGIDGLRARARERSLPLGRRSPMRQERLDHRPHAFCRIAWRNASPNGIFRASGIILWHRPSISPRNQRRVTSY
jgi:hypothetical protein